MPYVETTANLNIRERGEVIEIVPQGTVLTVTTNVWREVELEDGSFALASGRYLKPFEGQLEKPPGPLPKTVTGATIVAKAMTQAGDPYDYGYEVNLQDPDPDAFDCSELVEWVCAQLGVSPKMPDGAANQHDFCENHGTLISISQAVKTVGALLFRITPSGNHVVISRGDGSTIEAKGKDYGVGVFGTAGRGWTAGGLIPGVKYG